MQSRNYLALMVCATAMAAVAPAARSDAPCNKGYRDSTAAERATMTAVLQAAKKSPAVCPDRMGN